ncbi:A24 family peptidase [Neobacillus mesonae]|uniref:Prepilin peptidase n=1 Tax=Neobacillus mesonae TaxID=1193713 RepID=A0A3T0I3E9_9BACI|nr:prepilin peptidase [Neobacillus mesonae]AZU63889.1 prepilin peptidase [Neobacillus mesonae]
MIIYFVLGSALLISLLTDIKYRKILNIVTFPAIFFGFIYYTSKWGWEGFLFSGKGFLLGFSLLLIPYLLGGMGAGDVKLMAAIGSLMGATFVLNSFVYIALIGGLISAILIMKKYGVVYSLKSFWFQIFFLRGNLGSIFFSKDKSSSISFPYGVAIVLGTLCTFVWGSFI